MADIKSVQMEKLEDIAEATDWDFHECPGQESMGVNENLKAMLNYYIGEEDNYVVVGAVISCDQMSDRPVYIERKGNRIIISGEQGTKIFEIFESGPDYKSCYEVKSDMEGVRKLHAVHAIKQTAGGITFATVGDCTCLRDKREKDMKDAASIISLGNCKLIGKEDAERIEKKKGEAKKYGTCYCLISPDAEWVNPHCMESVVGECHDNGGINAVLPSMGTADILAPRPICRKTDHHSTMRWCTTNGMEEGITMLSTLLCTHGGIITIEKSGQVKNFGSGMENFRSEMRAKGFPDTYIDYLEVLHEKYPLWEFEADITGVSYTEFLDYQVNNETKCAREGVYATNKVFKVEKAYNVASYDAIRFFSHPYSMLQDDPYNKNFQNAMQFFRIDQPLPKEFVEEVVPIILKGKDEDFINAVINSSSCVNPFFMASVALNENGPVGEDCNGKKVYNYFNIGGDSGREAARQYAYNQGWFTMEACMAGSEKEFQEYINSGQITLYKMDWDYEGYKTGNVFQYATLVNDAEDKAIGLCKKDGEIFDLNQPFVFSIPVYTDIPVYNDEHPAFIDPNHIGDPEE